MTFQQFAQQFKELTGVNLLHYNQSQVTRRLNIIQQKYGLGGLANLALALQEDAELVEQCLEKLTINVTGFFRDREYWQTLKEIISRRAQQGFPLRFWSAGCATGEEAYSLAYMLSSMLPRRCWEIIASDVSTGMVRAAREGFFPQKALKGLSDREVTLFMETAEPGIYRVRQRFRETVKFFKHNLLQDSYPSELDFILCRNVIIHFNRAARDNVQQKLAQALTMEGFLFLGASEQILTPSKLDLVNEALYIYKKTKTG